MCGDYTEKAAIIKETRKQLLNNYGEYFNVFFALHLEYEDFMSGEPIDIVVKTTQGQVIIIENNDEKLPNWYYLLYFKNSRLGHEYLSEWSEGSFGVWGKVNDGVVAKQVGWYFETFLRELKELNLIYGINNNRYTIRQETPLD